MSRWFRSYADTHRNPKIAKLSDPDFRLWHQLLCIAAENDGHIPPAEDLKNVLNRRLDHLLCALKRLVDGSLIDPLSDGYSPRNWGERQFKSDTSAERTREWRSRRDVTVTVPVTAPDTETDTETEKEEGRDGGKPPSYAFFGKTIRLKPHDLDRWRRAYHAIADIEAEMLSLDAWFQAQPPEKRKNWFYITASALNKRHQENLANRRDYDRDRITV